MTGGGKWAYKLSVTALSKENDAFANAGQAVVPVSGIHWEPIVAGTMSGSGRDPCLQITHHDRRAAGQAVWP